MDDGDGCLGIIILAVWLVLASVSCQKYETKTRVLETQLEQAGLTPITKGAENNE
ncbi:MAG: hypothetical protein JRE40_04185 [Deltaproteobacteria bacterium]|nr:hypothetical protein [Deltaproteobacteria bacterium]